jgi:predicted enzyme related to lactoylglutathione lyase
VCQTTADREREGGVLDFGGVVVVVDGRADLAPTNPDPGRLILNFHVDDIAAVEARLVALEVIWIREVQPTPCGIIGTVLDPDGNCVQVIETRRQQRHSVVASRSGRRDRPDD